MCNLCLSRRRLFSTALSFAALTTTGLASMASALAQPARSADTADAALTRLVEGNARYVSGQLRERDFSAGRAARAMGQAPFAAILACADSRVAPELAFDQGPGELFVVRVAGNFVTHEGLGSLEFGAAVLGTKVIMVLGHTSCGAVNATVDALQKGSNNLPGQIAGLVTAMEPGIKPVMQTPGADIQQRAVVANIQAQVSRLQTGKSLLTEMIAAKNLRVVGAFYDLPTGKVVMV